MPGRIEPAAGAVNRYKYGFNGKENDNETVGTGEGTQDYGIRIYNPSLGKFLSVDPLQKEYPELTPYQFASNSPIVGIDRDGLEIAHYSLTYSDGKPVLKMLGVQIRRPSFRQEVIELFGTVDYNLFEYEGDVIKGLSFQVFYQGAVIYLNTIDDLAKFANAGEDNADVASFAYAAQQALVGHAVGEMKAMEQSGHQAFEDCYIYKPINVPKQNTDVISKQQQSSNNGLNSSGQKLDWNAVVPKKGKYAGQTREDHVRLHNIDNKSKPDHGIWNGDGVTITNIAWKVGKSLGIKPDANGMMIFIRF